MDKKFILIPLGIGVAIVLLFNIFRTDKTGNRFQMSYPDVQAESGINVESLIVYLDNSGSMKGFVDFAGESKSKSSMTGVIGNMMDNVYSVYHKNSVCICGGKEYTRRDFLDGMEKFSIFSGATTELHKMIQTVSEKSKKGAVSIIVTDMILSYGSKELDSHGDKYYNLHQLDNLGAQVHNAMTTCKSKGLDVIVLQYLSSFNGRYYCNFTENKDPNIFAGKIMENRPYYFMAIGGKEQLKSLMANHCFNKPNHVYASFPMDSSEAKQDFNVTSDAGQVSWVIGDPANSEEMGSISTTADFGDATSSLVFSCKKFEIPGYVSTNDKGMLKPAWDERAIDNVEEIEGTSTELKFRISLKPHNQLNSFEDVWVQLFSDESWINGASTDDDTKGDISRKTWGLSTVISNINQAYRGNKEVEPQKVAEFKFNIIKE